ncbi:NitT/TauT family transport system permease protein [Mitsuaria sp. PDC51]|uniref:ABC transporter permease n=1 Tax=unclassified Roseateles TaxID=2626991 RepID=UPI0008F3669F|nr:MULTISPECIES: ABC transporter permease subunit [unclassified Roseateles]MBB3295883.1 NitT/TauT family transport system permease protein [Mitsuaria sp. BK041]MBB3365099.1 NitT/TauT family transport system permease protein [Mitsuaria sp. BK045]SFR94179.1 NitT/TauT family transport system permease protein [Mitsuaria sp. PDC51]
MTVTALPTSRLLDPAARAEREFALTDAPPVEATPVPLWRRALDSSAWRQAALLALLAALWEIAARAAGNDLLLPTFTAAASALWEGLASGELLQRAFISLRLLLQGYALGVTLALGLTALATSSRWGRDLLSSLTAMFNPLPAIALLPLALLWFGLGSGSLIFVLVHAVLWPLALAASAGFAAVPETLRMAGRNYGLRGPRYVAQILLPAALPAILSGLRVGWAFAWRTLIAAELFFGASSGQGGLGWYIFQNRNELMTDRVFAGLALVILIGWLVERLVFSTIERVTVRRWGMQR